VRAEDAVVIKLKAMTPTEERVVRTSLLEVQTKFTDDAGKVLKEQSDKNGETLIYVQKVLPVAAFNAPRLERKYEKAEQIKAGKPAELSFQGKTLTLDTAADKRRFTLEGGKELPVEEVRLLDRLYAAESNEDTRFCLGPELPRKAVKVGDSWPMDMDYIAKQFAGTAAIDVKASNGNGKLGQVYDRGGSKFGIMEFHILLVLKEGKLGELTVQAGSQISVEQSVDMCIDGTRGSGTIKSTVVTKVNGSFLTPDKKRLTQAGVVTDTTEHTRTDLGK
jgi:hypothetical protein